MVSGAGRDPDSAVLAFGAATFQIALPIRLIRSRADTAGCRFESHPGDAGSD
jgi:hypothetical protein